MPPPENPPLQILLIEKADAATEAGGRSSKQKAELTRLETEMTKVISTSMNDPSFLRCLPCAARSWASLVRRSPAST
jgi:hypothetical protein